MKQRSQTTQSIWHLGISLLKIASNSVVILSTEVEKREKLNGMKPGEYEEYSAGFFRLLGKFSLR